MPEIFAPKIIKIGYFFFRWQLILFGMFFLDTVYYCVKLLLISLTREYFSCCSVREVVSRGQSSGPQGVLLELKKVADGEQAVKQSSSSAGGEFVFEKVLPGDYVIEASRSPWIFDVVRFFHCSVGLPVRFVSLVLYVLQVYMLQICGHFLKTFYNFCWGT